MSREFMPQDKLWRYWAAVQAAMVLLMLFIRTPTQDVGYYFRGLHLELDEHALADPTKKVTLQEYPDVGVWPLQALDLVTPNNNTVFVISFIAMFIGISAAFMAFLIRAGKRSPHPGSVDGARFWILFSAASGPIMLTRLDLVPGLLVALTAAYLFTRPRVASVLLGAATMSKLWPGVLAAGLVGRWNKRGTWVRLMWFALSLITLAAITAATSGVDRLMSPLAYQGDRGLQVESIFATPLVFLNSFNKDAWVIEYATSKSYEIFGPGVAAGVTASEIATAALIVFALGVALFRFLRGGWTPERTVVFFLALVILLIVTNKVFSPQYLTWFGPLLAVVMALLPTHGLGKLPTVAIIVAGLTTLIYPFMYSPLVFGPNPTAAIILTVRNVLMVYLAFLTVKLMFRQPSHRVA